ncbi:MAG: response regulator [Myxococcota bacterium]|jgi:two-component system NtrC family sensor kinase|nr:response regulator [Myxococcota bacterium]
MSRGALRILLVDDDAELLCFVQRFLFRRGHDVLTAAHGGAAIAVLEGALQGFDALVTDVQMSPCSGWDLLSWVAEHMPELRCFVVTGFGSAIARQLSQDYGAEYLEKPIDPALLAERLERLW